MMAIMYSHFHDEPPSLRLLRPDVPEQLCDAVMRMLRKVPEERWPTMEDAVAAAGSRPLAPDDPTRTQLIDLAKTGHTHRLVIQTTTPRSPIPKIGRRRGAKASTRARNAFVFGAAALGLVAAGFVAARMMTGSPPAVDGALPSPPPAVTSTTDSVTTPPANRVDSTPRNQAPVVAPRVSFSQPKSQSSPIVGRAGAPETPTVAPSTPDPGRGAVQRPESSVTPPMQKAETTASLPLVAPPPVSTSATSTQSPPPPVTRPVVEPAAEVTAVIQSYGRALASRDLAEARRIYQTMPDDQREGLEALWRAGGAMTPNWSVTDIVITGDVATARVRGNNVVVTGIGQTPSSVPVSLRARLERRGGEWRLVALIN
jgi:hypothetical protein